MQYFNTYTFYYIFKIILTKFFDKTKVLFNTGNKLFFYEYL